MSFTVAWDQAAEDMLTALWLDARDRGAISEAVDHLEQALRMNPLELGESRSHGFRLVFHGPLIFLIHVDVVLKTVHIVDLWRSRR